MKKILTPLLAFLCVLLFSHSATAQVVISSDFSDLNPWVATGGASIPSQPTGDSLTFVAEKNSFVTAALANAGVSSVNLASVGDFMTISFDLTISALPSANDTTFSIGFLDSSTGAFYQALLAPTAAQGSNVGGKFAELGDNNLGRFATSPFTTGGTVINLEYTLTRVTADGSTTGFNLTSIGRNSGGTELWNATFGSDLAITSTTFDTIEFNMAGQSWDENPTITLTDLNIVTNVPEPGTIGMLLGSTLLCFARRKRRS